MPVNLAGWVRSRDASVPLSPNPRDQVPFDDFDAGSIKALFRGEATEHQQKRLFNWLAFAMRGHESSFRGEDTHAMAFCEGQRALYLQIVRILNARMEEEKDGVRS